jgi:hypothetical protein
MGLGCAAMACALSMSGCNQSEAPVTGQDAKETQKTSEAQPAIRVTEGGTLAKTSGTTGYLTFQDRNSCTYNSNICNNTFVVWPGYIQNVGGDWGYVYMSNGPWTSAIGPNGSPPPSESSRHYHIMGLMDPVAEPNPHASYMFGTDWLYVYMQRSGVGRINFDLTQINILGTVPVRIWYKDAAGYGWQWSSLSPGRWNLPGATNIQEVHISSASGLSGDRPQIDDIQVKGR